MTERLTNLATSTLASPITTTGAITVSVLSGTRFPSLGDFRIRIDSELMLVTARSTNSLTVTAPNRGIEGTTAATHLSAAEVRHVISVASLDQRVTETIGAMRAAANGYASLDAGSKIPPSQLPASVVEYKGTWNATSNTPALSDATGTLGDQYVVGTAGTRNLGSGSISWAVGDLVLHNGSIWQQVIGGGGGASGVSSVAGKTGVVTLVEADITSLVADLAAKATQASVDALTAALAAKADDTDLTKVGPRKVLPGTLGSPYLLGTNADDAGVAFDATGTSAQIVTVPLMTTTTFPENTWMEFRNRGTSTLRVQTEGAGLLLESELSAARVSFVMVPRFSAIRAVKASSTTDNWQILGTHTTS